MYQLQKCHFVLLHIRHCSRCETSMIGMILFVCQFTNFLSAFSPSCDFPDIWLLQISKETTYMWYFMWYVHFHRGSRSCHLHVMTPNRPLVYSGNDSLFFAPYHTHYPRLELHMRQVGLQPTPNSWDQPFYIGMSVIMNIAILCQVLMMFRLYLLLICYVCVNLLVLNWLAGHKFSWLFIGSVCFTFNNLLLYSISC